MAMFEATAQDKGSSMVVLLTALWIGAPERMRDAGEFVARRAYYHAMNISQRECPKDRGILLRNLEAKPDEAWRKRDWRAMRPS